MLKNIYARVRDLSQSKHAESSLAAVSFAEASFFPIPVDVMLLPMAALNPSRAMRFALVATIASVIGGLFGYAIGMFLMDHIGKPLLELYGYGEKLHEFNAMYDKYGVWIILIKGLTPIPYKLVTIASGLAHFSIPVFIAASVVTRGARFFLVAFLAAKFGPKIEPFIEKNLYVVTSVFAVVVVLGFWAATHFF